MFDFSLLAVLNDYGDDYSAPFLQIVFPDH